VVSYWKWRKLGGRLCCLSVYLNYWKGKCQLHSHRLFYLHRKFNLDLASFLPCDGHGAWLGLIISTFGAVIYQSWLESFDGTRIDQNCCLHWTVLPQIRLAKGQIGYHLAIGSNLISMHRHKLLTSERRLQFPKCYESHVTPHCRLPIIALANRQGQKA